MSRRGVGALGGLVVLVLAAGAYMAPSGQIGRAHV